MRPPAPPAPPQADSSWRIGIVYSSFYKEEVEALRDAARDALLEAGIAAQNLSLHPVAGSFEVPLIGGLLAQAGAVDALIGLGIIVEGETHHAALLADQTAAGIMRVQIDHGIPFAFEVLHVDDIGQARERAAGSSNKGREAAYAVLHSLAQLKAIRRSAR